MVDKYRDNTRQMKICVHHNRGQIDRREAADFIVIVDVQDLLANLLFGPLLSPHVKLGHSCTQKNLMNNSVQ